MSVRVDAFDKAVTAYPGRTATLPEEHERPSWLVLVFITTVVFYFIDHSLFASVDTSMAEMSMAAEKASVVAAGNMKRQLAYLAFGLYGLVAWLQPSRFRLKVGGLVAVMLLTFLGWAALSLTWSVSPMLTLRRLSALALMAVGITGMLRQFSGAAVLRLILFMTLSYLVVGIGAEVALGAFRPWSSGYRFAGTLHPNLQGINCIALALSALAISATSRYRPILLAMAVGALGFLVLTESRGALTAGIAGFLAFWMLRTRRELAVLMVSVLSCVGVLSTFLVANGLLPSPSTLFQVERTEGVGMLTGRPDLWAILMEYARERPIGGYGYGAFFDPDRGLDMAARIGTWAFGGPHSVYLGALVDVGAVGLLCLAVVLLGSVWRSAQAYRHTLEPHFLFFTAFLVFQICDGFTESQLLSPNPWFIPTLAVAFLAFRSDAFEADAWRTLR
jgi:exopolysaccharide production protein ExoQ